MALEILRDPRLAAVEWKDLCELTERDVVYEVLIYTPWLVASLVLAHLGASCTSAGSCPALACSFMFFLCGLRQVHNAFHYAVGVSKRSHEWLMFVLSPLMMSAMHAVQYCHLRHHRHCMDEDDVEAMSAQLPAWKALLLGPKFPFMLHKTALQHGAPRDGALDPARARGHGRDGDLRLRRRRLGLPPLPRRRDGRRPVLLGLLRGLDRAPRLRPRALHRAHGAEPAQGVRHVRHVLPRRAPPLPDGADLQAARSSRSASTTWRPS